MRVAVKHFPIGKPKKANGSDLTFNWQPIALSPTDFVAHITSGKPFTVAIYKGDITENGVWYEGYRKKSNFIQTEILALDYDDLTPERFGELQQDSFIRQNAFAIVHSSSSTPEKPKVRVIFRLSQTLTEREIYEEIIKLVMAAAYPGSDEQSKDAARAFYGDGKKRTPVFFQPNNILDVAPLVAEAEARIAQRHLEAQLLAERNAAAPKINPDDARSREYLERIIQDELGKLNSAPGHGNSALYRAAVTLYGYAKGGYLSETEVERLLLDTPVARRRPDREARSTVASGKKHSVELHIPDPEQEPAPVDPIGPIEESAKRIVNMPYLDADELQLQEGVYAIKSGIGTNKTGFGIKTIAPYLANGGALWLVHRRTLSSNTCERLFENDLIVEDYQNVDLASRHILSSLVLSINGLVTMEKLRPYPVVVIDEIEQLLASLLSKELFKGAEGVNALVRLEHVIRNAKLVLCMDAHAGGISYSWLKSIREDVTFVENTYQRPLKPLGRFIDEYALLAHADQSIAEGGGVVMIGCASATTAKSIQQRYISKGLLQEHEVRCITQETNGPENQQFIRNINEQLPHLKLLIYSPSMGTGVDIKGTIKDSEGNETIYIKAVYCLFSNRERDFSVQDMLQMLGRARNAHAYYFELTTAKTKVEQRRSTSVLAIYDMEYQRVLSSRKHVEQVINDDGLPDISEPQRKLLKLFAKVRAAKNHSLNDLQGHFKQLCTDQYELFDVIEGAPPSIKREMKAARAAVKDERRTLVLTAKELHPKEYASKSIGGLTEADIAGYEKYLIHEAYGQEVTEEILDHDKDGQGRRQLAVFCSLMMKEADIARTDWDTLADGHALHLIKDHLVQRKLILGVLQAVWGKDLKDIGETNKRPVSDQQIAEGMERYLEENKKLLKYHFKWRPSYSAKPLDALRRILRKAGLELQLIRNQERFKEQTMYRVSKDTLGKMMEYRVTRLAYLKQKAVEREQTTRFGHKESFEKVA